MSPIEPRSFAVINPATEEPCAEIYLEEKRMLMQRNISEKSFETWGFTTKEERLNLFEKLYEI